MENSSDGTGSGLTSSWQEGEIGMIETNKLTDRRTDTSFFCYQSSFFFFSGPRGDRKRKRGRRRRARRKKGWMKNELPPIGFSFHCSSGGSGEQKSTQWRQHAASKQPLSLLPFLSSLSLSPIPPFFRVKRVISHNLDWFKLLLARVKSSSSSFSPSSRSQL